MAEHDLIAELERWGPEAQAPPPTSEEAWEYVRDLTVGHYENFSVLSRLVPVRLRADFAAVYAFCRWSDDLADETGADDAARARSLELLSWWRQGLDHCVRFARREDEVPPTHPVFTSLSETLARRPALYPETFHHLIDAFEQDQRVTRYETWDQVVDYCTRSADPVGRIVLGLGGIDILDEANTELVRMSDATCTALQLTNFWQDVRRDLEDRDRVYMPAEMIDFTADDMRGWMQEPNDPEARLRFIQAMRPLVDRTRELFRIGRGLPEALGSTPQRELAPVIGLFGAGGESVLTSVEKIGGATLWKRPKLGKMSKLWLIARASVRSYGSLSKVSAA
ncbi:MAG: squalene/phytoene synthase family protein [Planctomycetota bacterium]